MALPIDLSALPPDFVQLYIFGYFAGLNEKSRSYKIGLEGMSMDVPVSQEDYDNPPMYGDKILVRGVLNTTNFGGRPVGDQLQWSRCPDDKWPSDDARCRFDGHFMVSKDSYVKEGATRYFLKYSAINFQYQTEMDADELDRFPTGKRHIIGQLVPDSSWNKNLASRVTLWRCVPIGVVNDSKRSQKQ